MYDKDDDNISVTVHPTPFEEWDPINFEEMNILFYYEWRSTKWEKFM